MKYLYSMGFLALFITPSIYAQTTAGSNENPPEIAFLGTFHYGTTTDAMSLDVGNLSSPERQQQILEVVDALESFQPNKIILEYPYGDETLDSIYQEFRKGDHTLTLNERQQLGFRLAKKLGHEHIYVADHRMDIRFGELSSYLEENNRMNELQDLISRMKTEIMDVWQELYDEGTILDFYVMMNSDTSDAQNRNVYLQYLNQMGDDTHYPGVRVTAAWWERNFMIMRHIDALLEPGDRALVIFGQGHTAILKDLYRTREDVRYIDLLPFLRK